MANYQTVNIDEISDAGARVPDGTYTLKLSEAEGKMSKGNPAKGTQPMPMVVATFEVLEGEWEGFNIMKWIVLNVTTQKGKTRASGIMEIKKTLAEVGSPLPSGYAFPVDKDEATRLYVKALHGKRLIGQLKTKPNKNGSEGFPRLTIVGLATKVQTVDDDDFEGYEKASYVDTYEPVYS